MVERQKRLDAATTHSEDIVESTPVVNSNVDETVEEIDPIGNEVRMEEQRIEKENEVHILLINVHQLFYQCSSNN